jgi:hypothetical protein
MFQGGLAVEFRHRLVGHAVAEQYNVFHSILTKKPAKGEGLKAKGIYLLPLAICL